MGDEEQNGAAGDVPAASGIGRDSELLAKPLLEHARLMWDAEVHNFERLSARGRLIVASVTAMLGFVSALAVISEPGSEVSLSEQPLDFFPLLLIMIGYALVILGFYGLLRSSARFMFHSEEDAGALPNPNNFGEIGKTWWISQPTIDTVEERYLLSITVRRLTWIRSRRRWYTHMLMQRERRYWERRTNQLRDELVRKFRADFKLQRLRTNLLVDEELSRQRRAGGLSGGGSVHELRESIRRSLDPASTQTLLEFCRARYSAYIAYNASEDGEVWYEPTRDRGPRDMASLIIAVYIMEKKKEQGRRYGREVMRDCIDEIRTAFEHVEEIREPHVFKPRHEWRYHLGKVVFPGRALQAMDESEMKIDTLHPPLMVRSSSYYLQFAEAFAWDYCGLGAVCPGTQNMTGSGREFSVLKPGSFKVPAGLTQSQAGMNEAQWRCFISTYFSAQNLRSVTWNLWFRVKSAERKFLDNLMVIFIAFAFVSVGEIVSRTDLHTEFVGYMFGDGNGDGDDREGGGDADQ